MTDEELDRLPPLMREIVLSDRRLDEIRSQPAILMTEYQAEAADGRRLREAAAKRYGPRGNDDERQKG